MPNNYTRIIDKLEKIMAAIDDLNASVVALQAQATAADSALASEFASLNAALAKLANVPPDDSAAIEASVTNIKAVTSSLAAAVAAIQPAPAVAPVVAPAVAHVAAPAAVAPAATPAKSS